MNAVPTIAASVLLFAATALPAASADLNIRVKYACADGKTIDATYYPDMVAIVLSDGRALSLAQTVSGSGARYANADESVVFWNKGNDAFVTEGDPNTPTYADCVGEKQ